jgi:hypothetical protein
MWWLIFGGGGGLLSEVYGDKTAFTDELFLTI